MLLLPFPSLPGWFLFVRFGRTTDHPISVNYHYPDSYLFLIRFVPLFLLQILVWLVRHRTPRDR